VPDGSAEPSDSAPQSMESFSGDVRSIFFYNCEAQVGQSVGLHLFEARYRLLVQRALKEPSRHKQLIFLPNYREYIAAHGDIGFLASITHSRLIPDPAHGALPRADVQLRFEARVLVLFHWVEPGAHNLHECLFRRLPNVLAPPSSLLALQDVLEVSEDGLYTVNTRGETLGVHATPPSTQHRAGPLVSTLQDGEVIRGYERRDGWVRHDKGWSASRPRNDAAPCLLPERTAAQRYETTYSVSFIKPSANAPSHHMLLHAPSAAAAASVRAALNQASDSCDEPLLEVYVPGDEVTEPCARTMERVTRALNRYLIPLRGSTLSSRQLKQALLNMGEDISQCVEKSDLASLYDEKSRSPAASLIHASALVPQLLMGLQVPVACGSPCGMEIRLCDFVRAGDSDTFDEYILSQYRWELDSLRQSPAAATPEWPSHLANSATLHMRAAADPSAHVVLPARHAKLWKTDADAIVQKVLRRVNWQRLRLVFIAQRDPASPVSVLDIDLARCVADFVLTE